jgi:hypothetical protein
VDGPVDAARLAELRGAVERVDDPHPACRPPGRVIGALFGQDDIPGAAARERRDQELVRQPVARLAQHVRLAAACAQLEQPPARFAGQFAGQRVIGGHGSCPWSAW